MNKPLTPQQTFEEKIKDRIRADMGDLLPDELLKEMVKRSLEDFFFKDIEQLDRWGHSQGKRPGWFHTFLKTRLERKLDRMVYRHVCDQGPRMLKEIEQRFIEEAPRIIMAAFVRNLIEAPQTYGMEAMHNLEQRIRNAGLSNL